MIINSIIFLSLLIFKKIQAAQLMCTACTIGVASGFSLAKILGVNNNIIALWLGGVLLAIGDWSVYLLKKNNINNKIMNLIIYISSYCLVLPLYLGKNPSIIFNEQKILFIDSVLFYILLGSLLIFLTEKYYQYIKIKNGKPHFPFEKVVLPIGNLLIFSIIINFI